MAETVFYATLCAVILVLAARNGVRMPLFLSCALFVSAWLLYALNWTTTSLRQGLHDIGFPIAEPDLWAFTDGVQAIIILLIAYKHWWGRTLVALFCVQEITHDLYGRFGVYDWQQYTSLLNNLFLMQVIVFMVAAVIEGDRGLRDTHNRLRAKLGRGRMDSQANGVSSAKVGR